MAWVHLEYTLGISPSATTCSQTWITLLWKFAARKSMVPQVWEIAAETHMQIYWTCYGLKERKAFLRMAQVNLPCLAWSTNIARKQIDPTCALTGFISPNQTSCLQCRTGYVQVNRTCQAQCPNGYFLHPETSSCQSNSFSLFSCWNEFFSIKHSLSLRLLPRSKTPSHKQF